MSMFLIALAAWCVIRAGDSGDATGRMVAAGAVLALANAAAYSSALFDPIVILLALLTAFPKPGGKVAARRIAILLAVLITLLLVGLLIGGSSYVGGFERTTLMRVPGAASWVTVLHDSWSWTGVIVALAVCGIVISLVNRQGRSEDLAAGGPRPSPRSWGPWSRRSLHTAASLNKHVGLGAWFAAIAAGYAVDWFIAAAPAGRNRTLTCGACVLALAFPLSLGASQSWAFSTSWPNSAGFIAILRPAGRPQHTGACWSRTRPSPSTTCPPGASGSDGQAPGTSSCHRARAPAARARRPGLSALATQAPSPCTSARATSP